MKKKFRWSILFVLILTTLLVACGLTDEKTAKTNGSEEEKVLTVGTAAGRSPFIYQKDGKVVGYDAEVIETAAERAGYEVKWTTADFQGLFGLLDSGRVDTIANQLSVTAEREEKYSFSPPYVYSGGIFAVKKDNDSIKSLEDLKGKVVGVGLGTAGEKALKALNINNEFEIKTFSEDPTAELNEVALGRVDAYYNDQVQVKTAIEKAKLDNIKIGFGPLEWGSIAFPFTKDSEKLADIKKALEEMKEDGTLSEISIKWLEIDATVKE